MAAAVEKLVRYARLDDTIVLLGPTGTGKSSLALLAHTESARAAGPFEQINLGSLDDGVASSELFGHEAGAFTGATRRHQGAFERAQGGTLFCDEFAKASTAVQRKLLTVFDKRAVHPVGASREIPVNVRLVFAANESLRDLTSSKLLLHDFLPRLGLLHVRVPSLAERIEDLPEIFRHLVRKHARRHGYEGAMPQPSAELLDVLTRYSWPENVRELESLVVRLLADAQGSLQLTPAMLVDEISRFRPQLDGTCDATETDALRSAIGVAGGNKSRAARALGWSRSTLYRKLEHLDDSTD